MDDLLFRPITINRMEIKNRIFMPAMHLNMARDFQVTDRLVAFYSERAQGGAGMISVGYATVDEFSGNTGNIGAHHDDFIPGLTQLASAIRNNGARSAVQLNHAGRYNHSQLIGGRLPMAPSALASRLTRERPKEMTLDEIQATVTAFAAAAGRVKRSGFDAVEILCGTGYLISEFLSPLTNQRNDEYGGSFEKRMRFGVEVILAVRETIGLDFPLFVRLNGNEFMRGGSTRQELQTFAQHLETAGADAFCVNVGWHEAQVPQIVSAVPRGVFAYLARGIREVVSIPVIASHRINDPAVARSLLAAESCDMVAMGRALIADPLLPLKAATGRENEILHCVACGQGCLDNLFRFRAVECLCNPRAGHETERSVKKSSVARRVMVIGGGAAGMSAALAAADLGEEVDLYEQGPRLGGQLHLAGASPGREEFSALAGDLKRQVELRPIRVHLKTEVDSTLLCTTKVDRIIIATGGVPLTPSITGVDQPLVVQAWDLLAGRAQSGERVVIIGGGAVGVETALSIAEAGTLSAEALKFLFIHRAESPEDLLDLSTRGNKRVTIVEQLDDIGRNFGRSTRWGMLQDLQRKGVECRTGSRVLEITANGVRIETAGVIEELAADTVVLAVGTASCNPLAPHVAALAIPYVVVGDARNAAMVFDAVHQGFAAGADLSIDGAIG